MVRRPGRNLANGVVVPGAGHSVYFEEPFDTACIT